MHYRSPLSMLYQWEAEKPSETYLKQPIDGIWHNWTWEQTGLEVRQLAAALKSLSLPPNSHIAILSKNCAHWIICDLAIMMAGHVSIPLYPNLQPASVREILDRSESVVLFAGKLDNWIELKTGVPSLLKIIAFPFCENEGCESWNSFTHSHAPITENIDRDRSELATIIFTSGTTAAPKGVMFTFGSFAFVIQNAMGHVGFKNSDRFFSYLPLSHIAERMLVEMMSLYLGAQVSFAESLQTFAENLAEASPTVFLGVHRIWTKFQQGVLTKVPQKKLDKLLSIPVASYFIKRKIRKQLGLNETSLVFTGAAPTPPDLIKWFHRIGVRIQEAYAMTENCCYSHVSLKHKIKIGFVGQPLPHCEVRLGDDNEILIKHKALMTGYYKDEVQTALAFTEDGFFRTGDEGAIDENGFLKITGRTKDLFKTAKGKYVVPSPIEMKLSANPNLEQVCVVGSGLPQPMALITLSAFGKKKKKEELIEELKGLVKQTNSSLDGHEKLSKIIVVKDEWQVENNLLTPSLKIKRNEIERKYSPFYEDWSDRDGFVYFVE